MYKPLATVMTILGLVSTSFATGQKDCDYVQASLSNVKSVADNYGAKSFIIETKKDRLADRSVSFSFVDSQGHTYLGTNHIDPKTCQTEYYNVQKGISFRVRL